MARSLRALLGTYALLCAGCLSLSARQPTNRADPLPASRPGRLAAVSHWYYFLSVDLESDGDAFDRVAASSYDMVVIDTIFTEKESADEAAEVRALVARLQNAQHPKLVLAYIDIGQAEDFRTYWQDGWRIGDPEWIVGGDPDGWEGNYPVAYWHEAWRAIWLGDAGYLQAILDAGFDGIYLDWIEAYDDKNVAAKAEDDEVDARQEMIWWVEDLADYCRARQSDFLVIAQNAAGLAEEASYRQTIDAIAQEQVWFDGAADNDPQGDCPLPATDADVDTEAYAQHLKAIDEGCYRTYVDYPESTLHVSSEEYIQALKRAQQKGLPIFTVDYALQCANIVWVYETSRDLDFVPFASERALGIYRDPSLVCSSHLPLIVR